jgi:hypothetical protein
MQEVFLIINFYRSMRQMNRYNCVSHGFRLSKRTSAGSRVTRQASTFQMRTLMEVMVDEDDEELTEEDRAAIQAGLDSLDKRGGIPHEEILAEFGLTMADWEKMADEPDQVLPVTRPNG